MQGTTARSVMDAPPRRAVLTVATGKMFFWDLAMTLARSFVRSNASNDIAFFVLTDLQCSFPVDLEGRVQRISVPAGALGSGFSPKLHLDRFAPAEQTLFIDADCLCVRSLTAAFDRFQGKAVSVVGGAIASGEWFGDIPSVLARVGVAELPKFNGGVYYIERGVLASAVYEEARRLEPQYDDLGLVRLRGHPNDELLLAIAMARYGLSATSDDGSIMGDLLNHPKMERLSVLHGTCVMRCKGHGQPSASLDRIQPAIIHFLGYHAIQWPYRAEALKLKIASAWGLPVTLASLIGNMFALPYAAIEKLKNAGRPLFHRLFKPRQVRKGPR